MKNFNEKSKNQNSSPLDRASNQGTSWLPKTISRCIFYLAFFLMMNANSYAQVQFASDGLNNELVTTDYFGPNVEQGFSVALSGDGQTAIVRSEERRVGKEGKFRWSPY